MRQIFCIQRISLANETVNECDFVLHVTRCTIYNFLFIPLLCDFVDGVVVAASARSIFTFSCDCGIAFVKYDGLVYHSRMSVIFCYARLEEIGCTRVHEERMRFNLLSVALIHTIGTSTQPEDQWKVWPRRTCGSSHLICELAINMECHRENGPRQSDWCGINDKNVKIA